MYLSVLLGKAVCQMFRTFQKKSEPRVCLTESGDGIVSNDHITQEMLRKLTEWKRVDHQLMSWMQCFWATSVDQEMVPLMLYREYSVLLSVCEELDRLFKEGSAALIIKGVQSDDDYPTSVPKSVWKPLFALLQQARDLCRVMYEYVSRFIEDVELPPIELRSFWSQSSKRQNMNAYEILNDYNQKNKMDQKVVGYAAVLKQAYERASAAHVKYCVVPATDLHAAVNRVNEMDLSLPSQKERFDTGIRDPSMFEDPYMKRSTDSYLKDATRDVLYRNVVVLYYSIVAKIRSIKRSKLFEYAIDTTNSESEPSDRGRTRFRHPRADTIHPRTAPPPIQNTTTADSVSDAMISKREAIGSRPPTGAQHHGIHRTDGIHGTDSAASFLDEIKTLRRKDTGDDATNPRGATRESKVRPTSTRADTGPEGTPKRGPEHRNTDVRAFLEENQRHRGYETEHDATPLRAEHPVHTCKHGVEDTPTNLLEEIRNGAVLKSTHLRRSEDSKPRTTPIGVHEELQHAKTHKQTRVDTEHDGTTPRAERSRHPCKHGVEDTPTSFLDEIRNGAVLKSTLPRRSGVATPSQTTPMGFLEELQHAKRRQRRVDSTESG